MVYPKSRSQSLSRHTRNCTLNGAMYLKPSGTYDCTCSTKFPYLFASNVPILAVSESSRRIRYSNNQTLNSFQAIYARSWKWIDIVWNISVTSTVKRIGKEEGKGLGRELNWSTKHANEDSRMSCANRAIPFDPSFDPCSMQGNRLTGFREISLSTLSPALPRDMIRGEDFNSDGNCFTDLDVNPLGESIWTAA